MRAYLNRLAEELAERKVSHSGLAIGVHRSSEGVRRLAQVSGRHHRHCRAQTVAREHYRVGGVRSGEGGQRVAEAGLVEVVEVVAEALVHLCSALI